jgi:hypothetical protein
MMVAGSTEAVTPLGIGAFCAMGHEHRNDARTAAAPSIAPATGS